MKASVKCWIRDFAITLTAMAIGALVTIVAILACSGFGCVAAALVLMAAGIASVVHFTSCLRRQDDEE